MTLYNADTDKAVGSVLNGMQVNTSVLGTRNFNVVAVTEGPVGSVTFSLNGRLIRTENGSPFAMAGDGPGGDMLPWAPTSGPYTVTVMAFTGPNGTGTLLGRTETSFTVVIPPPPLAAAVKASVASAVQSGQTRELLDTIATALEVAGSLTIAARVRVVLPPA